MELPKGRVAVAAATSIGVGVLACVSAVGAVAASTVVKASASRGSELFQISQPAADLLNHSGRLAAVQVAIGLLLVLGGVGLFTRRAWGRLVIAAAGLSLIAASAWVSRLQLHVLAQNQSSMRPVVIGLSVVWCVLIASCIGYLFTSSFERAYESEPGSPTTR